jgi:DNA-binding PadR family transcriptional regulator
LASDGLVVPDHDEVVDSRLRRYYRLTESGAEFLAAEARRHHQQAETALRRLGVAGATA